MHLTTEQECTLICRGATVPSMFKHNEVWRVFKRRSSCTAVCCECFEHPFSLFLLHPMSLAQFYFISLLWLNVIFCFMSSYFNSQFFGGFFCTHKYSNTHSSLRPDGALTIGPKKGQPADRIPFMQTGHEQMMLWSRLTATTEDA